MTEPIRFDRFGSSVQGRDRPENEDHFLVAELSKSMLLSQSSLSLDDRTRLFGKTQGALMLVADGAGDGKGRMAGTIAVDTLISHVLDTLPWFLHLDPRVEHDFADELHAALQACRARIIRELNGTGTKPAPRITLTMAYLLWPRLFVVHNGNGRCYLLRDSALRRVASGRAAAGGASGEGAAAAAPPGEQLRNGAGEAAESAAEVRKVVLKGGDTLLLCTDGLSESLDDAAIQAILDTNESAEAACRALLTAALDHGGGDDATAVVAKFRQNEIEDEVLAALAAQAAATEETPAPE